MTRRAWLAAIVSAIVSASVSISACGPATPTSLPSVPPSASPPSTAASTATTATTFEVEVDPSLLDVLPAAIDSQPRRPDDPTASEIARTGNLGPDVEAIAVGLYVRAGSSASQDLAIVNVVRLRPDAFSEAWYRDWRTTYDDGACEIAGGVTPGAAQSRIGDHDTDIGTCQGGVHTYHVHLTGPDRVVSITAAGEGRYGELVVKGLTE